jgi:3-oxoadipate enol-lactonase
VSDIARIRDADIVYDDRGDGPTLIWGHGLSQSRATEHVLGVVDFDRLPGRVVRYDARGHGDSESTPELRLYGWDELARDQLALADHLGIDRYIAAGASMGCGTALHVAVQAPTRLDGLVLVIPPTGWETRQAQAGEWGKVADVIERDGVEPVITARAEQPIPDPLASDPTIRDRQADATRAWDPARLAHVMRGATYADLPRREEIASIGVPTTILAWSGDPVHPLTTAEELHALIAGSVLHVARTAEEFEGWTDLVVEAIRR